MGQRIAIIDGHPSPDEDRFCHALARAYEEAATEAGHVVRRVKIASLDVPILRTLQEWEEGPLPTHLAPAQETIGWANHLVFIYPLWLGSMPALLKAFLEQVLRPGFAIKREATAIRPGLLTGKSARIIVTMGMPALAYRWFFQAHSLKSLERNILKFVGIRAIRETLIGTVEGPVELRLKAINLVRRLARHAR